VKFSRVKNRIATIRTRASFSLDARFRAAPRQRPPSREHIRELSLQLFDQLQPVHHLPAESRVLLESASLLHDVGHTISNKAITSTVNTSLLMAISPDSAPRERNLVAAAVRYHNRKAEPSGNHPALQRAQQFRQAALPAASLRFCASPRD